MITSFPTTRARRHGTSHRRSVLRRRALLTALAVIALLTAACGGDTGSAPAAPAAAAPDTTASAPTPPATSPTAGPGCATDPDAITTRAAHERVDLVSDGTERWYTRYVPASYDGAPVPLVVDLHGYLSGSAGQAAMSGFGAVADEAGFVVVTPQGTSDLPFWNAVPHAELPDDIAFLGSVIDDASAELCIDPTRVYVDGFSNGAFLTSLVACRMSDRVAAVATVAGLLLPDGCAPARPVPILAIHGTEDRHVGFAGPPNPGLDDLAWNDQSRAAFDGLRFADVRTSARDWAALNGCDPEPGRTEVSASIERTTYDDCTDGSVVELYVVDGAGHTWPASAFAAASAPILGPATDEMDASRAIWSFFAEHRLDAS